MVLVQCEHIDVNYISCTTCTTSIVLILQKHSVHVPTKRDIFVSLRLVSSVIYTVSIIMFFFCLSHT